jgi:sialate O-acetylesterase
MAGKPLLHPLFSDEAVLQRGKPVAVWGWAAPGAEVTVVLAGGGLAATPVTTKAGADGRWQATMGPFTAGGPYTLTASSADQRAQAKDVLVGDVWLCSGQSNMGIPVFMAKNSKEEMAKGNFPHIRQLQVASHAAGMPQELIKGKWQVCTPNSVAGFMAVPYFFGRQLHQDLNVPIGLVVSAVGGTDGEAWASAGAMSTLPAFIKPVGDFQKLANDVAEQTQRTGKEYPALIAEWYHANDPGTSAIPPWSAPEYDTSSWRTVNTPPLLKAGADLPKGYTGTLWLRREVIVPPELAVYKQSDPPRLILDSILDWDTTWLNGQQVGASESPTSARNYILPPNLLKAGSNIIAVRVLAHTINAGLVGKPEKVNLYFNHGRTTIPVAGEWRMHTGVDLKSATPLPIRDDRKIELTSLYNGMIAPLEPLSLTGVVWYQGENNAYGRSYQYRSLLPTLIKDWRTHFGQGDFPFLIVALANIYYLPGPRPDKPVDSAWAELREAQAMTAKTVPNCGLSITIDVGEAGNIHPADKQSVGYRLALAAKAIAYGQPVEWSGPWYKTMTVEGSSIRLAFDHLGGGLAVSKGTALTGFAIAGENRTFVWAEARIDGDTVVVSSPQITKPVAVRYAWGDDPPCNLANKAGLPAVPFRTDDWPGLTWPKPVADPSPR